MAKGHENLKPFDTLSEEEQRAIRSAGGKKSGEVRRAKKSMKEMLDYLLEKEVTNAKGEKASTLEAISVALIKQAMAGNVKAYEVLRDTIGQKMAEQQTIKFDTDVSLSRIKELKKKLNGQ